MTYSRAAVNGTGALHSVPDVPLHSLFLCLQMYYSPAPVQDFRVLPRVDGDALHRACEEVLNKWKQAELL